MKLKNETYMEDKYKFVYNEALKYLYGIKPKEISDAELNKYFYVKEKQNTKNDISEMLFSSLQNYQSMPNVIGFGSKKELFKKILFDFDSNKIINNYNSYIDLLKVFEKEFKLNASGFERVNNSWVKYSKAVLSASKFMSQFKDAEDFDQFVNRFIYNESTAAALPMLLSKEIYGLGFALGCDFLKELGYDQYPKPDIHLIDVFSELGLSDRDEYNCYKSIIKMSRLVNETPYKVDKIFWLICSGNYYLDGLTVDRKKKDFIEYIKKQETHKN